MLLKYIVEHDYYWMYPPLPYNKGKGATPKGTKKNQARKKAQMRRTAIGNVYALIDRLQQEKATA